MQEYEFRSFILVCGCNNQNVKKYDLGNKQKQNKKCRIKKK